MLFDELSSDIKFEFKGHLTDNTFVLKHNFDINILNLLEIKGTYQKILSRSSFILPFPDYI